MNAKSPQYPTPDELWAKTFAEQNAWRDRFAAVPFEDRGGYFQGRYYQDIAIERVLESVAAGKDRILLTLATGTGKTFVAFQIAWKLFHARWSKPMDNGKLIIDNEAHSQLSIINSPLRRPRILFLADRNILANQAFNAFSAFPEDAMVRIEPDEIRKKGKVPKNGSLFFTIFQTFMCGPPKDGDPSPWFGDYPPDFFDFIVIDECHRGGANDESTWRAILNYFSPAVQLGLTATPKRKDNVDTYAYFGEPVFTYSLKEGINDGFLIPFRVKQIQTTMDEYVFTPDDLLIEGDLVVGERFVESDFNKKIEIKEREAHRVKIFMDQIDQREKTLVFCANQDHALMVRDLINQMKTSTNPDYCVRVTANDGERGEKHLREFQDNEKWSLRGHLTNLSLALPNLSLSDPFLVAKAIQFVGVHFADLLDHVFNKSRISTETSNLADHESLHFPGRDGLRWAGLPAELLSLRAHIIPVSAVALFRDRRHHRRVAAAAPQQSFEQGTKLVTNAAASAIRILYQLCLDPLEDIRINNPVVLPFVEFAFVLHLPEIRWVRQQFVQRGLRKRHPATPSLFFGRPPLIAPAAFCQHLDHFQQRAMFQIQFVNLPDLSRLGLVDHKFGPWLFHIVSQQRHPTRPLPLAAGGGDLVAGAFRDDFPFELSE